MPKRLLSYDPGTGVSTYHEYDHNARTTTFGYTQDVAPILDHNHNLETMGDGGYIDADKSVRRVASIPSVVQQMWMKEGINIYNRDHWPQVRKKLNDPEWRYLRTAPGSV